MDAEGPIHLRKPRFEPWFAKLAREKGKKLEKSMFSPSFLARHCALDQSWENDILEDQIKPILKNKGRFGN